MIDGLVVGVLNVPDGNENGEIARKYRDLTISWLRYGYQGNVIERHSVDAILAEAAERGGRYCLILTAGCVVAERWQVNNEGGQDFFGHLADWINDREFLVAGRLTKSPDGWYGIDARCLLVDLCVFKQLRQPTFGASFGDRQVEVPCWIEQREGDQILGLSPTDGTTIISSAGDGWEILRTGLRAGMPFPVLDQPLWSHLLDLEPASPHRRRAMSGFLRDNICRFGQGSSIHDLNDDQRRLLSTVYAQAKNARRGVFLWNIESYDDIEDPSREFQSPAAHLYSVAAGFKPCRILQSHGCDRSTRVVYFDYSQRALDVRRYLIDQWDGNEFPRFVKHLFQVFPHPETFYQLWDGTTPDNVDWRDVHQMWDRELARWGGADRFASFWQQYRQLPHEFICCNLLEDTSPLLTRIENDPQSIVWWSNAFFTMYGNWHYASFERQRAYERWISGLVDRSPAILLFGSDFNNTNVNDVRAAEYWEQYRQSEVDEAHTCRVFRTAIRM